MDGASDIRGFPFEVHEKYGPVAVSTSWNVENLARHGVDHVLIIRNDVSFHIIVVQMFAICRHSKWEGQVQAKASTSALDTPTAALEVSAAAVDVHQVSNVGHTITLSVGKRRIHTPYK